MKNLKRKAILRVVCVLGFALGQMLFARQEAGAMTAEKERAGLNTDFEQGYYKDWMLEGDAPSAITLASNLSTDHIPILRLTYTFFPRSVVVYLNMTGHGHYIGYDGDYAQGGMDRVDAPGEFLGNWQNATWIEYDLWEDYQAAELATHYPIAEAGLKYFVKILGQEADGKRIAAVIPPKAQIYPGYEINHVYDSGIYVSGFPPLGPSGKPELYTKNAQWTHYKIPLTGSSGGWERLEEEDNIPNLPVGVLQTRHPGYLYHYEIYNDTTNKSHYSVYCLLSEDDWNATIQNVVKFTITVEFSDNTEVTFIDNIILRFNPNSCKDPIKEDFETGWYKDWRLVGDTTQVSLQLATKTTPLPEVIPELRALAARDETEMPVSVYGKYICHVGDKAQGGGNLAVAPIEFKGNWSLYSHLEYDIWKDYKLNETTGQWQDTMVGSTRPCHVQFFARLIGWDSANKKDVHAVIREEGLPFPGYDIKGYPPTPAGSLKPLLPTRNKAWTHYSIPLDGPRKSDGTGGNWSKLVFDANGHITGYTVLLPTEWQAIINNVTRFDFNTEFGDGGEDGYVDNVKLIAKPEVIHVPDDYPTIHEAISQANKPGETRTTIGIFSGTYNDGGNDTDIDTANARMVINKDGITLLGFNSVDKPVINAAEYDYGLYVKPLGSGLINNVTIKGLAIKNYGNYTRRGGCAIGVEKADKMTIQNNTIQSTDCINCEEDPDKAEIGIFIEGSKDMPGNIEISRNKIFNAGEYGIYLVANNASIHNNTFKYNWGYSIYARPHRYPEVSALENYTHELFPSVQDGHHYTGPNIATQGNIFYKGLCSRTRTEYAAILQMREFASSNSTYFTQAYSSEDDFPAPGSFILSGGTPNFSPALMAKALTDEPPIVYYSEGIENIGKWAIYKNLPTAPPELAPGISGASGKFIHFGGTLESMYILGDVGWADANPNVQPWQDTRRKVIQWKMRYSQDYAVYVCVQTSDGKYRFITYHPPKVDFSKVTDPYVPITLSESTKCGEWITITRDLQADLDLQKTYSGISISKVNAFLLQGSGDIAYVGLMEPQCMPKKVFYSEGLSTEKFYRTSLIGSLLSKNGILEFSGSPVSYMLGDEADNSLNRNDTPWADTTHKEMSWSMKFPAGFKIAVIVETTMGRRQIVYSNAVVNRVAGSIISYLIPGTGSTMQTITRDLADDLEDPQLNGELLAVNGMTISTSGTGWMDNIVLGTSTIIPQTPPSVGSVTPASGSSKTNTTVTFTTTYSDPNGWWDIMYVNFKIGATPSWSDTSPFFACYNQNAKRLYLINDTAKTAAWLAASYAPGTPGATIANSYAILDCANTTVVGAGRNLTVKWRVTFKSAAASSQTKNSYLFVKDDSNATNPEGWAQRGTWLVGNNTAPAVGTITPATGTSPVNVPVRFNTTYSDPNGWQDIQYVYLQVNSAADNKNGLLGQYNQNTNKLYLCNDNGATFVGGYAPGAANIIENSYARLYCSGTTVAGSGSNLNISWQVSFKTPFTGNRGTFLYVRDDSNAYNGWIKKGNWTIPNNPPSVGSIIPAAGSSLANQTVKFNTTYSDPDTWLNILDTHLLVNTLINGTNCFFGWYNQNSNRLYIRNDANTAWIGGYAPGTKIIIKNNYARLDCYNTTVTGSGNNLYVNWAVNFNQTFLGTKNTYLFVRDDASNTSSWTLRGTWTIK